MERLKSIGGWLRQARRERHRGTALRDVRRLPRPDRFPLRPKVPDGLDQRTHGHHVALARPLRRRLRRHREGRDPLRSHLRRARPPRPAHHHAGHRHLPHRHVRALVPRGPRLRALHEGAEDRLPRYPLRRPLHHLPGLRRRGHRPLRLARCGTRCAARRPRRSTPPRRAPAYEPHRPVHRRDLRHHRGEPSRAPHRSRHDRGLDPLSLARRPRHGHRRRAAAQRHVHRLAAARRAALHPFGRDHELGLDDRPPAQVLRRPRRPLPWRARPGQRRPVDHLCRHVRLRHRRRRRAPAR